MAASAQGLAPSLPEPPAQASEIERRQEHELEAQRARAVERPDILSQPPSGDVAQALRLPAETPCFTLSALTWQGELPPAGLLRTTQSVVGHCVGEQGLRALHTYLMGQLIKAGLMTSHVVIPEQSLATGQLTLRYEPGRISAVRSEGAMGWWRTVLPTGLGGLVNQRDLDQALENLRRLRSQAEARIDVAPGGQRGLSDIVIHPGQAKRWHAYVGADNAGLDEMGKIQVNAGLTLDSPLFLYDQLSVAWNSNARWRNADANTRAASVNYNVPFGYWGVFAGASLSRYRYQLAGSTVPIFYSGTTQQLQAGFSLVPYRGSTYKGNASLTLLRKRNTNAVNDHDIAPQRRDVTGYEFYAAHRHYLGQAVGDIGDAVRGTLPQLSDTPGSVYGVKNWKGASTIFSANIGLYWPFKVANQSFSYRVTGQLQHTKTPIVPADYFTIGNRYSVRGFDGQRTLAAENGWTLRNDFSLNLAGLIGVPSQEFYTGLDVGRVGGPFAQYLSGRTLVGTVIGWRGRFTLPFGTTSYDLSLGWPLHKPAALKTARPVGIAAVLFEF
jgi:hemolysin activation/secretion protein